MDINIKGGGLTRTVKADCPEFPIQLGQKVSDQEVKDLDLIFGSIALQYPTTDSNKYANGTGLLLGNIHNTTSNTYLVFYNIPMQHIDPGNQSSGLPEDQWDWLYYTASGAFMILPYQSMDIKDGVDSTTLLVPNLMSFPYADDFWAIRGGDHEIYGFTGPNTVLSGDKVLPYVKVFKLNEN